MKYKKKGGDIVETLTESIKLLLVERQATLNIGIDVIDNMMQTVYRGSTKDTRISDAEFLPVLMDLKEITLLHKELIEKAVEKGEYFAMVDAFVNSTNVNVALMSIYNSVLNK